MPRKPGRTLLTPELLGWKSATQESASSKPTPHEISGEKYRELAFKVLTALNAGLVERLIRNPQSRRAGQWLKERFLDERWFRNQACDLAQIEGSYENGGNIVDQYLAALASRIANDRPPRENAPLCNWVTLHFQYAEAVRTWDEEKSSVPTRRSRRVTRAEAAGKAASQWARNLYAEFNQSPRFKCECDGKIDPPSERELAQCLEEPGDESVIVYVLSHYHGLTPSAVRRLLDEASRHIKRLQVSRR